MQVEYADRNLHKFENPVAPVVRFCPKIRLLGPSDFKPKNGMVAKFNHDRSSSRTIDELDDDTAV